MSDVSSDEVLRASDEWQWVPQGAETFVVRGVRVVDYPEWARMGFYVTPTKVTDPPVDVVEEVHALAKHRRRPASEWWISPSTEPAELEAELQRRGATLKVTTDILAIDISGGLPDLDLNPDIECRLVVDEQTLEDAEEVAAAGWGGSPSGPERRAQQLRDLAGPIDGPTGFRVVAYRGGRPISTAGCELTGEVARLYGGVTLAKARGQGGYRATVAKRLTIAHRHGARLGLVHARVETSLPILERVGFKSYGAARLYVLAA